MKTTFCVEMTAPRGSSHSLAAPIVDAEDEVRAVEAAHKVLDKQGFPPRAARTVFRIKPVWEINKRAMSTFSGSFR